MTQSASANEGRCSSIPSNIIGSASRTSIRLGVKQASVRVSAYTSPDGPLDSNPRAGGKARA